MRVRCLCGRLILFIIAVINGKKKNFNNKLFTTE